MKKTAIAPSNIAFIKYWGKTDDVLRIPENTSISMNLSGLTTTTTVEFDRKYEYDEVIIDGKKIDYESKRVIAHIDRIRKYANISLNAKIVSKNNFPSSTGLSSSASGFAALTVSASAAAGLKLGEKKLSVIARHGSGSACRSIPDGFVEWINGKTNETSFAKSIFPADYWDICDIVVIISNYKKDIPTSEGMKESKGNVFLDARLKRIDEKIKLLEETMKKKDFNTFGEIVENEALELHAVMFSSGLIYVEPDTIRVMKLVRKLRNDGIPVYFTVNTGQDVHLICEKKDADIIVQKLNNINYVKKTIINFPSVGAKLIRDHLF